MNNICSIFLIFLFCIISIFYVGRLEGFKRNKNLKNLDINVNVSDYTLNNMEPLSIMFENFLDPDIHEQIKEEYKTNKDKTVKRVMLNTDIIHSNVIIDNNMIIPKIFHSKNVQDKVSKKINEIIQKEYKFRSNNVYDPYNNFIQVSSSKGEGLNWHFDQKFYKGKVLVGLYTIYNKSEKSDKLSSQSHVQKIDEKEITINPPPNSFVLFEASEIYHAATPIGKNETRVVYQTVYSSNSGQSLFDKLKMLFGTSESLNLAKYTMKMGINKILNNK